MNGFFKPFRRKCGLVTLVPACVLMIGWIRSFAVGDFIIVPIGDALYGAAAGCGFLSVGVLNPEIKQNPEPGTTGTQTAGPEWSTNNPSSPFEIFESKDWRWQWNDFGVLDIKNDDGRSATVLVFPYWIILLPLTLLAAGLLLDRSAFRYLWIGACRLPSVARNGLQKVNDYYDGWSFHGWKRKIGTLIVALACLFAAAWVRSTLQSDGFSFSNTDGYHGFSSFDGRMSYLNYFPEMGNDMLLDFGFDGRVVFRADGITAEQTRRWNLFGVQSVAGGAGERIHYEAHAISYWSITAPLMLLAAWLLLRMPRSVKATERTAMT